MRTLILLVAASLAVVIRTSPPLTELKYGDILAFPHKKICGIPYTYKHYAIYLDQKRFPEQKDDQNLFHFTGPVSTKTLSGCIFDKLKPNANFERDNYLDNFEKFQNNKVMSEDNITTRITEKYKNCKRWLPSTNNCEHLATYVRYGYKISLQCGQKAEKKVKNPDVDEKLLEEIKAHLKEKYEDIHKELEVDLKIAEGHCSEVSSDAAAKAG